MYLHHFSIQTAEKQYRRIFFVSINKFLKVYLVNITTQIYFVRIKKQKKKDRFFDPFVFRKIIPTLSESRE